MPPNTSDSRHSVLMALSCGCFFCSAIFSGRMWISRKMPIPARGAMNSTTQAAPSAIASSVSPWNSEACAVGASAPANKVAAAIHARRAVFDRGPCAAARREGLLGILAPSAAAERPPRAVSSIADGETQLELVEVRRAGRLAEIDPVLLVTEAHGPGVVHIPAHAEARAVGERIHALGGLPLAADVAVPGIPPAGALRRAIGDVGVDEGVADLGRDIGRDRTVHEVEVHADPGREGLHAAIYLDGGVRQVSDDVGLVVDVVPVEAEGHFQLLVEAVAEGEGQAQVTVELRPGSAFEIDIVGILVDQVAAEFPTDVAARRLRTQRPY